MRHRKGVETPILSCQNRPGRNRAQPALALRPDRVGEVALDECQRLVAPDDLDGPIHPIECEGGEEARQPQHMIEVSMCQQHVRQAAKSECSAHQLTLGAFAAIDQKPAWALSDEQCRQAALSRRYCGGSTEKDEIEHEGLPNSVQFAIEANLTCPSRGGDALPARITGRTVLGLRGECDVPVCVLERGHLARHVECFLRRQRSERALTSAGAGNSCRVHPISR